MPMKNKAGGCDCCEGTPGAFCTHCTSAPKYLKVTFNDTLRDVECPYCDLFPQEVILTQREGFGSQTPCSWYWESCHCGDSGGNPSGQQEGSTSLLADVFFSPTSQTYWFRLKMIVSPGGASPGDSEEWLINLGRDRPNCSTQRELTWEEHDLHPFRSCENYFNLRPVIEGTTDLGTDNNQCSHCQLNTTPETFQVRISGSDLVNGTCTNCPTTADWFCLRRIDCCRWVASTFITACGTLQFEMYVGEPFGPVPGPGADIAWIHSRWDVAPADTNNWVLTPVGFFEDGDDCSSVNWDFAFSVGGSEVRCTNWANNTLKVVNAQPGGPCEEESSASSSSVSSSSSSSSSVSSSSSSVADPCLCAGTPVHNTWRLNILRPHSTDPSCQYCGDLNAETGGLHDLTIPTGNPCGYTGAVDTCGLTFTMAVELYNEDDDNFSIELRITEIHPVLGVNTSLLRGPLHPKTTPCDPMPSTYDPPLVSQANGSCQFDADPVTIIQIFATVT